MIEPSLEMQIRSVCAALELLSFGSTQQWDASGGHEAPGSRVLWDRRDASPEKPPHIRFRERFDNAKSDRGREAVIDAAKLELDAWRGGARLTAKSQKPQMSEADLMRHRILTEGKGWSAADVARALRCTVTHVRKVRLGASIDDSGNFAVLADEVLDQHDRVRELGGKGLSERQIAMMTGCAKTTIRRILRRAA